MSTFGGGEERLQCRRCKTSLDGQKPINFCSNCEDPVKPPREPQLSQAKQTTQSSIPSEQQQEGSTPLAIDPPTQRLSDEQNVKLSSKTADSEEHHSDVDASSSESAVSYFSKCWPTS